VIAWERVVYASFELTSSSRRTPGPITTESSETEVRFISNNPVAKVRPRHCERQRRYFRLGNFRLNVVGPEIFSLEIFGFDVFGLTIFGFDIFALDIVAQPYSTISQVWR